MIDIRQVMYDIERCVSHVPDACRDCSHYTGTVGFGCMENLMSDALVLLKKQEEEIENLKQTVQSMMEGVCLLKEQEVKTGHWIDSAGNDKCSICGEEYSDLYPDYDNTHFCPNCGAKMEGR